MATSSDQPVRVRIAPSPTGPLHFGTARTALFNWLFARKNNGVFIVRIDDTDKERSEKKYEGEILSGFAWLGLDWDEGPATTAGEKTLLAGSSRGTFGPYRQSERMDIYKKYLKKLLEDGHAYYCYCTKEDLEAQRQAMLAAGLPPKYSGHCRNLKEPPAGKKPEVIRFKVPDVKIEFKDLIRGKVSFDAALLGDQVIAKDLNTPLYNFATVVDDELMEISHVIRGEDHISNTPKQILIQKALGFTEPVYGHLPLVLSPDRSKMSKRYGDTDLSDFRKKGYLPNGMMNFMALLGWHSKEDKEVMMPDELIKEFDIARVQSSGAIFNEEKLNYINREHLKKLSDAEIVTLLEPFIQEEFGSKKPNKTTIEKIVMVERMRANTLSDIIDGGKFFFHLPDYEAKLLVWKDVPYKEVAIVLADVIRALESVSEENFHKELLTEVIAGVIATAGNRGTVLWPLRVALSGQKASPDPLDIMDVLGKKESLRRIDLAIQKLKSSSNS
ncbi:MAG TPA: glutamate--tRNA ligase [Candidatus Paceibacterota bacterium]|nr:glutamate--tRNA ligase [Candidatus Paceibacterota bacterium]